MRTLLEKGTVLDGKYEIIRQLGGGGMGEVCLVKHLHLDELRVIKVLRPEQAADPTAHKRFLRAARTASQIKHPNVASLYDSSKLEDGSYFMVWEYVEGIEVGQWIEEQGAFRLEAALDLGIQALQGLGAIHTVGVIHRDISPDNLMITRDRQGKVQLKIIDLGLAKHLEPTGHDWEVTQAGMFLGKLRYCSPEQAGMVEGVSLDARSDQYSFAMVLYEMLCGLPPFDSETHQGIVFKRLTEDPIPLTERAPALQLPAELDEVVRRGMARERDERFPDTDHFIAALRSIQESLSRHATQTIPVVGRDEDPMDLEPRPPRSPSTGQLTREERDTLLQQIEQAAERRDHTESALARGEEALAAGRTEEAREIVEQIAEETPRATGLADFTARLDEAAPGKPVTGEPVPAKPATPAAPPPTDEAPSPGGAPATEEAPQDDASREAAEPPAAESIEPAPLIGDPAAETERMLDRYLAAGQLPLARLALQSLLEIHPKHALRKDYERQIKALADRVDKEKKAGQTLAEAREALAAGDLKKARRRLSQLRRRDPEGRLVAELEAEIARAEGEAAQDAQLEQGRERLEALLDAGELDDAALEIERLAGLGVSRVTLNLYQTRLGEAREQSKWQAFESVFEERFLEHLSQSDWDRAREVAREMDRELPGTRRSAEMFAEVARREDEARRAQAVQQGVEQVEALVAQGDGDQAAIALKILARMAPQDPRLDDLRKAVAGLRD